MVKKAVLLEQEIYANYLFSCFFKILEQLSN